VLYNCASSPKNQSILVVFVVNMVIIAMLNILTLKIWKFYEKELSVTCKYCHWKRKQYYFTNILCSFAIDIVNVSMGYIQFFLYYVVSFLLKSNKPKFDLFFIFLTKNWMDEKLQCAKVSFVLKRSLVQRSNQVII